MAFATDGLLLPPLYRLLTIDAGEALPRACAAATDGADAGTLVWARRADLFDCAVVLEPEMPLDRARPVVYVAMLGLGDALAALGPPQTPINYAWPDRVEVDGGVVGGVRLAAPPAAAGDAVPDWLVLGATLRIAGRDPTEPGRQVARTALLEEGFEDLDAPTLLESYSRHLLYWMNRWEAEGFAPVGEAWLSRLSGSGDDGAVKRGLDPAAGDLLLLDGAAPRPRRQSLAAALAAPSWTP